ncbi:MAG TPA: alpha/beta hydrolase [Alphaproteobacteria bacterium]|nr:alpha/beta hydrolase [Alphaproteobacteria bacterium]
MAAKFPGFSQHRISTSEAEINLRRGGDGPPVLLLHGYPETHLCWHRVAPLLARRFTVVAADLRGYGDSSKPASAPDHAPYSKRSMAQDMVEAMARLGFTQFAVVGHDRGARVAYRMALDHPNAVAKLAVLDIVPTYTTWMRMQMSRGLATYHWFFLAQPDGLPERLIGADPAYYLKEKLRRWSGSMDAFPEEVVADYVRCFSDPACIHASCEDYRAGATIDFAIDKADYRTRKIACPVLALWGQRGFAKGNDDSNDPVADWREWADDVRGQPIRCGHFLPEEAPEETTKALEAFL